MIAESSKQFNCEGWGGKIEYHGPYNNYECDKQNRLYAINKDNKGGGDNDGKDNKLNAGAIAGIVIAVVVVVGAVIFILVYFLVIKKKNRESSEQDSENNEKADEV